jgi:hypothetical protein
MENTTTKVQIDIPLDFDIELEQWMLKLKSEGVRTSKAKQIVKFAIIGFRNETKKEL